MTYRLLGAVLIIAGCGGFGFSMVLGEKQKERLHRRLISSIKFMQWELSYRLTPLPELLRKAGSNCGGEVGELLKAVSEELSQQLYPDAASCMQKVLSERRDQPRMVRLLLRKLGMSLGSFDLGGQLEGLKSLQADCEHQLKLLEDGKMQRFRSYETLGICAGAALAILFI